MAMVASLLFLAFLMLLCSFKNNVAVEWYWCETDSFLIKSTNCFKTNFSWTFNKAGKSILYGASWPLRYRQDKGLAMMILSV